MYFGLYGLLILFFSEIIPFSINFFRVLISEYDNFEVEKFLSWILSTIICSSFAISATLSDFTISYEDSLSIFNADGTAILYTSPNVQQ